ncbi:MFS transporter [Actinomadura sp. 7K507]|uniref:MFS transporter n=1 Tax=Actinomadura sp. 7K507 TaxID=2530365 RepID=UPI00104E3D86|nr:MFS transporter [Actinomadura sp. 7K507]TDC83033.1 MFS transporter [Actinomadura sp. 7K507]
MSERKHAGAAADGVTEAGSDGHGVTEAESDGPGHPKRWWILGAVCTALLIIVVDNTVLSVALPALGAHFEAGTTTLQAVADAYVVVFAGLLLAAGAASDRYGRRRTLVIGLALFAAASAAAALAPSASWLIGARAAMGVGAALVMPPTLAILVQVFPASQRPKAFAVWTAVAAIAMAGGPALGGLLVAAWSWAAVFWINVPLAAAALLSVVLLVPESADPDASPIDLTSVMLVTLGMGGATLAVLVLSEPEPAWATVGLGAAAAVTGLTGFALRQRRVQTPLVDFALYRDRNFAGASLAAALLTLGTGSTLFVLTQHLQLVLGFNAAQAGAALAPLAAGVAAGSIAGGRAPQRIGARFSIVAGFLVIICGFLVLASLDSSNGYPPVALGLAVLGLGTGFSGPAVTSTVLGAVPRHRAGMGSALNDTHQQLGIAIGIAVIGGLLATAYRTGLPDSVPPRPAGSLNSTLNYAAARSDTALADTARTAFTTAQTTTMLAAAGCAAAGALVAARVLRARA